MIKTNRRDAAQLRLYQAGPGAGPFLKWAGGKAQLLPTLQNYYPAREEYETYFEPFLGGGAVFFELRPRLAFLSDSNHELINTYEVVQKIVEDLIAHLQTLQREYRASPREKYHEVRDEWDVRKLDDVQRATRFVFLNKTCFNGLYRVNRAGKFNVPFGKNPNATICDRDRLRAASDALRGMKLQALDFRETLRHPGPDDFVYVDPPYDPISKTSSFTGYTKDAFTMSDQEDLAKALARLNERGTKILMSSSLSKNIQRLYPALGFKVLHVTAPRAINSNPDGRGRISELLIRNFG